MSSEAAEAGPISISAALLDSMLATALASILNLVNSLALTAINGKGSGRIGARNTGISIAGSALRGMIVVCIIGLDSVLNTVDLRAGSGSIFTSCTAHAPPGTLPRAPDIRVLSVALCIGLTASPLADHVLNIAGDFLSLGSFATKAPSAIAPGSTNMAEAGPS